MISLLTTSIPHISRLCCNSCHDGSVRIVNTLDALEKTRGTPLCLAFSLLYQQCWSSQGVLQVNLCHYESKAI